MRKVFAGITWIFVKQVVQAVIPAALIVVGMISLTVMGVVGSRKCPWKDVPRTDKGIEYLHSFFATATNRPF